MISVLTLYSVWLLDWLDIVLDSNPLQQVFKAIEFIASHHKHTAKLSASAVDFQLYTLENLPARELFTEV